MHNFKLEKIPKIRKNGQNFRFDYQSNMFFYRKIWFKHGLNKNNSMEQGFKNQT